MNYFLLSVFCGLTFAVDLIAAYFGWIFVRRTCFFGWIIDLTVSVMMYRLAVSMACRATLYLGVTNGPLIENLLLMPIIISSATSIFVLQMKKYEKRKKSSSSCI